MTHIAYNAAMVADTLTNNTNESNHSFEDHAVPVIRRLQAAASATLGAIPNFGQGRAVDLATTLNLDFKLAWKMRKFVDSHEVFEAAPYALGAGAMRIFLRAASRAGIPRELLTATQAAFEDFIQLVKAHGGNRRTFDMLCAGQTKNRQPLDIEHRRQMFVGGSYVWGAQTRICLRTDILAPSPKTPTYDIAVIRGFVDLRRLRPNVPWRVASGYTIDEAGNIHTQFIREPLEPRTAESPPAFGPPMITEFCSKPLPECRQIADRSGLLDYELGEAPVGNVGNLTCLMGEIIHQVESRCRTESSHDISTAIQVRTPSEELVFDVFMHRELVACTQAPIIHVCGELFTDRLVPRYRDSDRLPIQDTVEDLGFGINQVTIRGFPAYTNLLKRAFERTGWNPDDFKVFRFSMQFPPFPCSAVMMHKFIEDTNNH